jgi:hypothetical protein
MATTTTNFGWDIPQSTDLVKDGATAIAALGQDIDTALVDLKGGTTGQVLAKATGTDLDFSWVAQDDSNAIQNAIVDAKGDLISATANDTPARLAVGANGTVLTADSSTATGLAWSASAGGGDITLITTNTFTAQSNISINNCFTSTYQNYIVEIVGESSASSAIRARLRKSGADLTSTLYEMKGSTSHGPQSAWTLTSFGISVFASSITFFNPVTSGYKVITQNSIGLSAGVGGDGQAGSGWYDVNTSGADGFSLFPASGTITGTIRVYGLKD